MARLACFWLPAIVLFLAAPVSAHDAATRPNILVLLTDDQRFDMLGCAGNRIIQTPSMDSLAKNGIRFTNAFVTTSICPTSRASIFTGLQERTHGYSFGTKPLAERHVLQSYPALLKKAGYRVGFVGKFCVGVPKGMTQAMFDSFVPSPRAPHFRKQADGTAKHFLDIEADRAIAFLDTLEPGQPFCLSVSFNAPHAEDNDPRQFIWPKSCDGLYADAVFPVPKTMNDDFFKAQPRFLRESESRVRYHWRFDEPRKYQDMVRGYYRLITGIDQAIARIVAALKKRGLADNTIIIFLSDNGFFLGERGFADKWYIYEYSIRIPLIIFDPRAPGQRRGKTSDQLALNTDIAPTILELTGRKPAKMQGRSLAPLLRGENPPDWRTDFLYEHLFVRKNIPRSEGVRNERFTYVRWLDQKPPVEELYDHRADFEQTRNLVDNARFRAELESLRRRTDELRERYARDRESH
ncbi:MAG: sulfatase [Planctomycetes bacterium]|nr:sulfatase [Planctomycetota bacterium]